MRRFPSDNYSLLHDKENRAIFYLSEKNFRVMSVFAVFNCYIGKREKAQKTVLMEG